MKRVKTVVGLNVGHDGGCTIVVDGRVAINMSEERINRIKNSYGWVSSFKYCLERMNLSIEDIDLFVFSDYNDKIGKGYTGGLEFFGVSRNKIVKVDHHLSHACASFFTSGFDESLIYIIDGRGNNNSTESVFIGKDSELTKIAGNPHENYMKGLVATYQAFTSYFGWHQDEAGKTMGLAPYGDIDKYKQFSLFEETSDGWFVSKLQENTALGLENFCRENSIEVPEKFSAPYLEYADMAAWIQNQFEKASIKIIDKIQKETGIKRLCMAGGGALNSVINTKILEKTGIDEMFIFPASGDSGQSIGNALYGYYIIGQNIRDTSYIWRNDYRNIAYSEKDILDMLERTNQIVELIIPKACRFRYSKLENVVKKTAQLLSEGNIIGWFQGGSEIGPRALGHRSILCDARPNDMKDKLNNKVKHREPFRPFAASVLESQTKKYFKFSGKISPYMLFVVDVVDEYKKHLPAITHVDGTCRIQTLNSEENGIYYDLVEEFSNITGISLILNTSFNLAGEPIVETPFDALKCFLQTDIDYLVINNYLIEKTKI